MSDLIFFAGGECLERFGTLVWRQSKAQDVEETHTRSGTVGYSHTQSGVINSDANIARVEWVDGSAYLLLEEARTNLLLRSEELGTTWSAVNVTVTNNDAVAPDGQTTAEKITASTTSTQHYIYQDVTATADAEYVISAYAKPDGYKHVAFLVHDSAISNYFWVIFNVETGAIHTSTSGGTGTYVTGGSQAVGDYYRVWAKGTVGNSDTSIRAAVHSCSTSFVNSTSQGPTLSWSGDGTSGCHVWGVQFEDDVPSVSSYISTSSATVTRNADNFYADFVQPPQEMTVYSKHLESGISRGSTVSVALWQIGSTTTVNPRLRCFAVAGTTAGEFRVAFESDGSGATSSTPSVDAGSGDVVEMRTVFNADGSLQSFASINGAAEVSGSLTAAKDIAATAWGRPRFYVNSLGALNTGCNSYRALKVARGTKSMQAMRNL